MGRTSDRWLARPPSPHYGGYTTRAVRSGHPPHKVIVVVVVVVVECYCFLKRIIDVGASLVADVSLGLFCIYSKNGGFAWTVVEEQIRPKMRRFGNDPTTRRKSLDSLHFST